MNGTVAPSRYPGLNLARRPFVNGRPVTRVALLLWAAGLLLLLGNVSLFWSYFAGSEELRAELAEVREQAEAEGKKIARLESEFAGLDLRSQNEQVLFLNGKITERTFSWSLLFDRLAAVMPDDVRLDRLLPRTGEERGTGARTRRVQSGGARRQGVPGERVMLGLSGQSRNDEALYRFVDNLFTHPAFDEPDLTREDRGDDGLINFDIQVVYLPGAVETAAATPAAPTAAPAPAPPIAIEEAEPR